MNTNKYNIRFLSFLGLWTICFIIISIAGCTANNEETGSETTELNLQDTKDDIEKVIAFGDTVTYTLVDKMPEFPGGDEALLKFIQENVKYPVSAQEKGIEGRVVCSFAIEKDGSIHDIEVVRGIDPALDEEAVRVINISPNWIPGEENGEPVRVKYTLPIMYKLYPSTQPAKKNTESVEENMEDYILTDDTSIYTTVDKMPQFPGGDGELLKFVSQNINYPEAAKNKGIKGRVVCSFIIEKDGSLTDVKVERGIDPLLDKEAVRMIKSLPNFRPGIEKGEIVRVRYTMPIAFRLQ